MWTSRFGALGRYLARAGHTMTAPLTFQWELLECFPILTVNMLGHLVVGTFRNGEVHLVRLTDLITGGV